MEEGGLNSLQHNASENAGLMAGVFLSHGLGEKLAGGMPSTRSIGYDGQDRLTALQDGATVLQGFSYEASGNTTAIDGEAYDYSDHGRLIQVRNGTAVTAQYLHNGRGERVVNLAPSSPARNRYFVCDEDGHLLGEYTSSGALVREYVWLDDTLVAVFGSHDGSDHQYVLTDHLGTPRAVVQPNTNTVIWRWDLGGSAFGEHAPQDNPDGNAESYVFNLRYPGQYIDNETGLHYNYFRDFEPSTGRYVQSDPIGLAGGVSTYGYVSGEPLTAIDPFGLADIRLEGNSGNIEASERLTLGILNSECKAVAFGSYALDWVPFVGFLLDVDDVTGNENPNVASKVGALGTTIGAGAWTFGYLAPAWQNQMIEDMKRRPGTAPRVAVLERRRDVRLRPANRWKMGGKLLVGVSRVIATYEYYQALEECECRANGSSQ